jgi:hypothetical protein
MLKTAGTPTSVETPGTEGNLNKDRPKSGHIEKVIVRPRPSTDVCFIIFYSDLESFKGVESCKPLNSHVFNIII